MGIQAPARVKGVGPASVKAKPFTPSGREPQTGNPPPPPRSTPKGPKSSANRPPLRSFANTAIRKANQITGVGSVDLIWPGVVQSKEDKGAEAVAREATKSINLEALSSGWVVLEDGSKVLTLSVAAESLRKGRFVFSISVGGRTRAWLQGEDMVREPSEGPGESKEGKRKPSWKGKGKAREPPRKVTFVKPSNNSNNCDFCGKGSCDGNPCESCKEAASAIAEAKAAETRREEMGGHGKRLRLGQPGRAQRCDFCRATGHLEENCELKEVYKVVARMNSGGSGNNSGEIPATRC